MGTSITHVRANPLTRVHEYASSQASNKSLTRVREYDGGADVEPRRGADAQVAAYTLHSVHHEACTGGAAAQASK